MRAVMVTPNATRTSRRKTRGIENATNTVNISAYRHAEGTLENKSPGQVWGINIEASSMVGVQRTAAWTYSNR